MGTMRWSETEYMRSNLNKGIGILNMVNATVMYDSELLAIFFKMPCMKF